MSLSKIIMLSLGLLTAGMSAEVQADTASLKAAVGTPFSVRINTDKNCSTIKPLDQINLLINGMDSGLHPLGCDPATEELTFAIKKSDITPSPATDTAWQAILGSPWNTVKTNFQRELRYTVSQSGESPTAQTISNGKLSLLIANLGIGLLGALLGVALWIALGYLGCKSGMLRDDGNQGASLKSRTFSLGRVQMAWWFGIIMSSYIFLWAMTREIPTLGSQALLLMGISGVTGLTSAGLNAGKDLPVSSGNFFEDLLTDAYGVTLHRFQMLAITVILGVMFLIHVVTSLSMPDFDGTLLSLMGIAGGTYVGFKVPETQAPPSSQTTTTAPASAVEEHKAGYTPEPAGGN